MLAANADPLGRATIAAIAAGVSTRRYEGTLDPLPPRQVLSDRNWPTVIVL